MRCPTFTIHICLLFIETNAQRSAIGPRSRRETTEDVVCRRKPHDYIMGKIVDASQYAIGAGKNHRDYNSINDSHAQKSTIETINLPERYAGSNTHYSTDIALLRLAKRLNITPFVLPVCMDWHNEYNRRTSKQCEIWKGDNHRFVKHVMGWGVTAEQRLSSELQAITLPFIDYRTCYNAAPEDFKGFLTSDKFCAGYSNGSSVCDGDSGGGLCFEHQGTWVLRGLVSISPVRDGSCDPNHYAAFTNVKFHMEWIRPSFEPRWPDSSDSHDCVVVAGHYSGEYTTLGSYAQKSLIKRIDIATNYRGMWGRFINNAAIIYLKTPFTMTTLVRPICIDWENKVDKKQLPGKEEAKVYGGILEPTSTGGWESREAELIYIPRDECFPRVFSLGGEERFLQGDTFCVTCMNGSDSCRGNAFPTNIDYKFHGIWYLIGVGRLGSRKPDGSQYLDVYEHGQYPNRIRAALPTAF